MRFGGLTAVNDLSFEARKGDITALIGPNGAGKTTCSTASPASTSRPGMMTLRHSGAAICWSGCRLPHLWKIAKVARTFQNIRLFGGMTVLENLLVAQHNPLMIASGFTFSACSASGYRPREGGDREGRFWLDKIGLIDRADDPAGDLPYGDQRRLEIARAMCTEPVLLCLDEPAAGLNPRESHALNDCCCSRSARISARLDPADRARHVGGDGDFRPCRGARLRHQDRRRHARPSPADPKVIAAYLGVDDEEVAAVKQRRDMTEASPRSPARRPRRQDLSTARSSR
jgi:branched-chain amino acid transport system ATP-binding protein